MIATVLIWNIIPGLSREMIKTIQRYLKYHQTHQPYWIYYSIIYTPQVVISLFILGKRRGPIMAHTCEGKKAYTDCRPSSFLFIFFSGLKKVKRNCSWLQLKLTKIGCDWRRKVNRGEICLVGKFFWFCNLHGIWNILVATKSFFLSSDLRVDLMLMMESFFRLFYFCNKKYIFTYYYFTDLSFSFSDGPRLLLIFLEELITR